MTSANHNDGTLSDSQHSASESSSSSADPSEEEVLFAK